MTENLRLVASAQMVVTDAVEDILVAYGVGSCIVVCLYDSKVGVGGMLHALLPAPITNGKTVNNSAKFVNQGLPLMIEAMQNLGAKPTRLVAKLGGGASILAVPEIDESFKIGQRNIHTAETALQAAGIPVIGRVTGGSVGRTIKFHIANGQVIIRSLKQKEQVI